MITYSCHWLNLSLSKFKNIFWSDYRFKCFETDTFYMQWMIFRLIGQTNFAYVFVPSVQIPRILQKLRRTKPGECDDCPSRDNHGIMGISGTTHFYFKTFNKFYDFRTNYNTNIRYKRCDSVFSDYQEKAPGPNTPQDAVNIIMEVHKQTTRESGSNSVGTKSIRFYLP